MRTRGGKYIVISLKQPPIPIIKDDPDEMEVIIKCPYCGQETKVGLTYMISGFVGCKNCYFEEGGLFDTTMYLKRFDYPSYVNGGFYNEGYLANKKKWKERKKKIEQQY
ncbi:hypothetical protein [uncultured Faecalicoccus sp.]|uniref:hypothetical protein n=1 Tax=uncultured Faecalicoccus sp. TaxID=1971760 RepID=UPI002587DAF1|nr:hypothetical protein [uncultured Faecalicoccus sp.]